MSETSDPTPEQLKQVVEDTNTISSALLANDYASGIAPATTKANLKTIVNTVRANTAGMPVTVLIIAEWQRADATPAAVAPWADYVIAAREAAEELGAGFLDIDALVVNTPAAANPYGLVKVDKVHPTDAGALLFATAVLDKLFATIASAVSPR
jgi:lysophospholipase L1-like esterase